MSFLFRAGGVRTDGGRSGDRRTDRQDRRERQAETTADVRERSRGTTATDAHCRPPRKLCGGGRRGGGGERKVCPWTSPPSTTATSTRGRSCSAPRRTPRAASSCRDGSSGSVRRAGSPSSTT